MFTVSKHAKPQISKRVYFLFYMTLLYKAHNMKWIIKNIITALDLHAISKVSV